MDKEKIVELNEQEAGEILQLLDVAVKAMGLQAASVALKYVAKFQQTFSQGD